MRFRSLPTSLLTGSLPVPGPTLPGLVPPVPRLLAGSVLLAVPLLLAGTAPVPATAAPSSPSSAQRTLVLELPSAGTGANSVTVPAAETLTAAKRQAVARSLLPSAAAQLAAEHDAVAAGLTVVSTNGSAVTVSGPQQTVDALVGSDAAAPVTPAAWQTTVAGVIDASAGAGMWHSNAVQSYPALSQAYGGGVPNAADPAMTARTPVIASLQLSGWDPAVLSTFAHGVFADAGYDPVASGQYTAVSAGRSSAYTVRDGQGDDEVSLDQETLLAAAPQLRQRAYFAANNAAGYAIGLQDIYNDVVAGQPIVALSTSWGACETLDSVATRNAIDATLAKLTAAGVTVFAASGDSGTEDCSDSLGNPAAGVDFPASDPHVLGVGATTHPNGPAAPAPDTAWSQAETTSQMAGGSGGGSSTIFARPAYQNGVTATAGRDVPDLAIDGDPNTGVSTVIEDPATGEQGSVTSGGTSLSSPLVAAMVANVAASRSTVTGVTAGFGDIHNVLYAHPEAFTDVVAATQAFGEGTGPTAPATPGYDQATGLGTPRLDVLSALLAGTAGAPSTVAAAVLNSAPALKITSFTRPKSASATSVVTWSTSGGTVGASSFEVAVTAGGHTSVHGYSARTRSSTFTLPAGIASVQVVMQSSAGSESATSTLGVPTDDRRVAKGWTAVKDRSAYLGTLSVTAVAGRRASLTATGTTYRVTVRKGITGGLATVLLDGRRVGTLDTFSGTTRENVTSLYRAKKKGRHTLTVVVLDRHDAHARGATVALDALSVS